MQVRLGIYIFLLELSVWYGIIHASHHRIPDEEIHAKILMDYLNKKADLRAVRVVTAGWNYQVNITKETLEKQLEVNKQAANESKEDWLEAIKYNWKTFKNETLKREFMKHCLLGSYALPEDKFVTYEKIVSDMQAVYATAKICDYKVKYKCNLSLEPELLSIMRNSRDPEELKHVWIEWRNKNKVVRSLYPKYVTLANEYAHLNNFTNNADYWLDGVEDPNFMNKIDNIWEQVKPLYLQLHAYVRFKLRKFYGEDVVTEKGPIPVHLLGNMWGQSWIHTLNFTVPIPGTQDLDVTRELVKQEYTPEKIFKLAENFFISLNLSAVPPLFWKNSILEKPQDGREIVCHPSAWDLYTKDDFRIKQCTTIDEKSMLTAHHEMGHIQYYIQYKDQPYIFKDGANPGFHEAVGDVMALSVSTTKHLKKIKLIDSNIPENDDIELNNLYKMALEKIAVVPFAYIMDLWRLDIFRGKVTPKNYNCKWWHYRHHIQGVEPPVDRTEEDFDPAAKYHIVADVSYLRYFVATIIQFQFHLAACKIAGRYDPNDPNKLLHKCDIFKSKKAGNAIRKMLQMGSSKPWPDVMEVLTGERELSADGILEYFEPLRKWLENDNKKNNVYIGWKASTKKCENRRTGQNKHKRGRKEH